MRGIHNSVLVAVVVHCRARMGLCLHHWMAMLGLEFPGNWPYNQRRDKPREQILSDLPTIAPFRAMPCVHPPVETLVLACDAFNLSSAFIVTGLLVELRCPCYFDCVGHCD